MKEQYENLVYGALIGILITIFITIIIIQTPKEVQEEPEKYCIEWDDFLQREGLGLNEVYDIEHGKKAWLKVNINGDLERYEYIPRGISLDDKTGFIVYKSKLVKTFPCTKWLEVIKQKVHCCINGC